MSYWATPSSRRVRAEVCAGLHGEVLEVGFGSGRNLAYLPHEVTLLWAVEPSRVGVSLAATRIAASKVPVVTAGVDAARLEFPDDRVRRRAVHREPLHDPRRRSRVAGVAPRAQARRVLPFR